MKLYSKPYLSGALVAFMLIFAYSHTLNFPFQFDDYNVIVDEARTHSLNAWWQSMPGMRPLLKLTYALNWQLEAAPRFFRLFNLVCHFVTSILVWRLVKDILPFLHKSTNNDANIAMLTAIFFALHPAHTEVVTYISSRSTGLMAMFCMISLYCWLLYIRYPKVNYLTSSIVFWVLAILVKEPALVLPLIAWLITRVVRPDVDLLNELKRIGTIKKVTLILLILALLIYLWRIPQYVKLLTDIFSLDSLKAQLTSQPYAHWHYVTQTLFGINLNVDYALAPVQGFDSNALLKLLFLFGMIAICLAHLRRMKLIVFSVLWWFICLIPSNSFIPRIDLINDRQIYLASIGPLLLMSTGLVFILTSAAERNNKLLQLISIGGCAAFVSVMFAATWLRNWDFETEISLWQSSLKQQPNNARAWNNLGYAYLQNKQTQNAVAAFENALELDPENHKAIFNLRMLNSFD